MQSPKFESIKSDLVSLFSPSAIKDTWKNKLRNKIRQSPISDPINHFDFEQNLEANVKKIQTSLINGRYTTGAPKRYKVEKSKGLCRQLVLPSVQDCIVLQQLSDALHYSLKSKEPTKKAYYLPGDGSFSKKFDKIAQAPYGSFKAWINFQNKLFQFTEEFDYIVVTDIANYYDFIRYDHLRNVISGLTDKSETILDLLIFVLSGLVWQPDYMPRKLVGLPQINIDAPRLLAHAFLFEIDKFIDKRKSVEHVRFMDDIDIGANTEEHAKSILRDLDLVLQARQLRLNSGKTKILTKIEAIIHFRIKENHVISKWEKHLDWKIKSGFTWASDKANVVKLVRMGLRSSSFNDGNGGKILTRLIGVSTKIGARIRLDDISQIVRYFPNSRGATLRHLSHRTLGLPEVRMLHGLIMDDLFIDDDAFLAITRCLLEARVRKDKRIEDLILRIAEHMGPKSEFGPLSGARLIARFLEPSQTLNYLHKHRINWVSDERIGRFIGALLPYFVRERHKPELESFNLVLDKSVNGGAIDVRDFFNSITVDKPEKSVLNYVKNNNPSLPLKCPYEKIGMIVAININPNISASEKAKNIAKHSALISDPYYNRFF